MILETKLIINNKFNYKFFFNNYKSQKLNLNFFKNNNNIKKLHKY